MTIPTIFETCRPRPDVLTGAIADADFAADLAAVIAGRGSPAYRDPVRFFADTYPTRGLRNLLANVCRRLAGAGGEAASVEAYRDLWAAHRESLAAEAGRPETAEAFRRSYPLHPEVLETLTGKTATLDNFQRVRGMLRLLARTITHLWEEKPRDATAIHLHHVGPGYEPIRQEIVTRFGQTAYLPAVANDVAAGGGGRGAATGGGSAAAPGGTEKKALAQEVDAEQHRGLPPYAAYVRDRTPLKKGQLSTWALRGEFRRDPALPVLIDDDVFVRGVRRGVEQGEYVYRRGDLLLGPGDPPASIGIDEQSVVFTMAYARNAGIWPRPPKPGGEPGGGGSRPGQPGEGGGFGQPPGVREEPGTYGTGGRGPPPPESSAAPLGSFTAEGVLKEALVRLWEQARSKGADRIGTLTIRMFEPGDAFRLLRAVGAVSGAEKAVTLTGGYETRDGGSFQLEFHGPVPDAQPVREFLEPQLRDAAERDLQAGFELNFADGLAMRGDAPEKLTDRLARFASGAAYVSATATATARAGPETDTEAGGETEGTPG